MVSERGAEGRRGASGPAGAPSGRSATGLLGPAEIRELARRLRVTPTKRLGQNFVHDANTIRRIARAARLSAADVVVEVGPGLGSLTLAILPDVRHVHAIEIDPRLADALPSTVATHAPSFTGRLSVLAVDAMTVRAGDLDPPPTALVANLPYNVAVPVVLHLLAELPTLRRGLVMVQREVADRLTARPGSRVYGAPSAKLAWYADARQAGRVAPNVFWPVPNVDSGLVAFTRREPPAPADLRQAVFAVVDAAFAQRRKMLRSALADWAGGTARAERVLAAAGVPATARGEELTIEELARVAGAGRAVG